MSLREEQRLLTRERVLDSAYAVFQSVGYREATIDQITTHAAINRATFYLHFKDKLEVAVALGRRATTAQQFHELDELANPTLRDVRNWLERYIAACNKDRMLAQMLQEAITSDPAFTKEYMDYVGRVADRMTSYLSRWSGKRREIARSKIILIELALARYLSHTFAQGVPFPGSYELEALAEMVWSTLFVDTIAAATQEPAEPAKRRIERTVAPHTGKPGSR